MKKAVALVLAMLMLLSMAACAKNEEESKPENSSGGKLYVLTQEAYYDKDGICVRRFDYTYDDAAQMLKMEVYLIERSDIYYPEWDVYVEGYTKDSPLNLYGTVQREYDKKGNITAYSDPKYIWFGTNGTYAWAYEDGRAEGYTFTYNAGNFSLAPTWFDYDENGNITRVYIKTEGCEQDVVLFEYSSKGRLTREISASIDGVASEKTYTYKDGRLSGVQLRRGLCDYSEGSAHWADNLSVIVSWELKYDGKLLSKLVCYDENDEKVETRAFSYDKSGYPTEKKITYYTDGGTETETETYTCDKNGNIIMVQYEDGTWVEYTYQAVQATTQQENYYHRRQGIDNRGYDVGTMLINVYYDVSCYYFIPNPVFALPYFLQFATD